MFISVCSHPLRIWKFVGMAQLSSLGVGCHCEPVCMFLAGWTAPWTSQI